MLPYPGCGIDQLTIGGEIDQLTANLGMGRAHAAIHWRTITPTRFPLGEAVAIAMLRDVARCWNEPFEGFSFTKFDGTRVTGIGRNT